MRILCAWCYRIMILGNPNTDSENISHGICDECLKRLGEE